MERNRQQAKNTPMVSCPYCSSTRVFKAGFRASRSGERIQRYLCRDCLRRFSHEPSPSFKVELNIAGEGSKILDSSQDYAHGLSVNLLPPEPSLKETALSRREDSGSHDSSTLAEPLNIYLFYDKDSRGEGVEESPPAGVATMNPNQGDGEKALLLSTGEGVGLKDIPENIKGELIGFAWWLKKQGKANETIEDYVRMLRLLVEMHADLQNPESVKEVLASSQKSNRWKALATASYSMFLKWKGMRWEPPKVIVTRKIPFIPTEEEIDALIAGCGFKTSTLLRLLKETGMRIGEALRLRWIDIDFQRRIIILNQPEKNGMSRMFQVSSELIGMLSKLPKDNGRVFGSSKGSLSACFYRQRKRIATKLGNPRLLKIGFHTLRHWKATMEYHKTKDILHVKELLGHRGINTTLLYVQIEKSLFNDNSDEFTVRVAKDPEEIKSLLETGFEYVCTKDDLMFFRKRK